MRLPALPAADHTLVQIVDAALADATRRSGKWLTCRPGCTQCCVGVFPISQLDALRLQHGLAELEKDSPERAARVRVRAQESVAKLSTGFPGDSDTGILGEDENSQQRFEEFANDEPCPALDPSTGMCDLYASRPLTCRAFGPPVRTEEGIGVCELCFQGATNEEIAACEMELDPDDLESKLLKELDSQHERRGQTIIAFALACKT